MIPEWAVNSLQQYGLAGVVIIGLVIWVIRQDSYIKQQQSQLNALSVDTVKTMTSMLSLIQSIKDMMSGGRSS